MFQNICLSMYIYIYICIYFLMLCERMNKSRARLRSREIRGSYSSVKAAAGRQLCSEKVCSVSERLQERSIVSLSLSLLLFCSLSLSRLNCFTKLAHLNIFFIFYFFFIALLSRGYTFHGKNRLWSWLKISRCLAPTRFTA